MNKRINKQWTKEKCHKIALKYSSRREFEKMNSSAYWAARKNKWFPDISLHMSCKPHGYWTKEKCHEKALLSTSKGDFSRLNQAAYSHALKNGWLDEICKHMRITTPKNYWTKEKCQEAALKCKTRSEFDKNYHTAHTTASRKGWLKEITSHLPIQGSKYLRFNYAYEFPDNHVYVGLTYNMTTRNRQHMHENRSSVFKHIKKTGLTPKLVYDDLKKTEIAQQKEQQMVSDYQKKGWTILNQNNRIGLIGGVTLKWTEENCRKEALKYKSRSEFRKNSPSAYYRALKLGIIHEITANLKSGRIIKWTKKSCLKEALKYKSRSEFQKNASGCYQAAFRKNFLHDVCLHMKTKNKKPKNYWTKEKCQEEALRYKNRAEFHKNSSSCYSVAVRKKILNEICVHMKH